MTRSGSDHEAPEEQTPARALSSVASESKGVKLINCTPLPTPAPLTRVLAD